MKNLIYLTFTEIPSKNANSYQSFIMSHYLSKQVDSFMMIALKSSKKEDPFKFYGTPLEEKNFKILLFSSSYFHFFIHFSKYLWFSTKRLIFTSQILIKFLFFKNKSTLITRDPYLLLVIFIASKFNSNIHKIFFEAHKLYPRFSSLMSKVNGIIVTNQFNYEYYNKLNSNLILERNGVEIKRFKSLKYKDINFKKIIVCYLGSFQKWKGVDVLIKSFCHLDNNFHLLLVGANNSDKKHLKKICKNLKIQNFTIEGFKKKSEIIEVYNKADVLVLPNSEKFNENLSTSPIKLFEYMSTKRLIIASNIPSIREIINEEHALFFESDNHLDLANKIMGLRDNNYKNKIKKSYTEVKQYSWRKRAERIFNFVFN